MGKIWSQIGIRFIRAMIKDGLFYMSYLIYFLLRASHVSAKSMRFEKINNCRGVMIALIELNDFIDNIYIANASFHISTVFPAHIL